MVTLGHSELVRGVQEAMADQLQRDGRLTRDMEIGLTFFLQADNAVTVTCRVRRHGRDLYELKGSQSHLCAVAAQLALRRLRPTEHRSLLPRAEVRWRALRPAGEDAGDEFVADVAFEYRN